VFYSRVDDWFLVINRGETHEGTIRIESSPVRETARYEYVNKIQFLG
jgi:hypothetical protein